MPQTVIIPINLRSFSMEWHNNPFYNFSTLEYFLKSHSHLRFILFRPYQIFKIKPTGLEEKKKYLRQRVVRNGKDIGAVEDFHFIKYADHKRNLPALKKAVSQDYGERFNFLYLYTLTTEHPKIQTLNNIVKICQNYDTQIIFYILPVDYKIGKNLFPAEALLKIQENVARIRGLHTGKNISFLDLSFDLGQPLFCVAKRREDSFFAEWALKLRRKRIYCPPDLQSHQKIKNVSLHLIINFF